MALEYKLEYIKDGDQAAGEGVFIQIKKDVPSYRNFVGKEDYYADPDGRSDFVDGLFDIDGITNIASQAFRVYVEKSPIFHWTEVLPDVLDHIAESVDETVLIELPGSGLRLESFKDRRSTTDERKTE